MRGIIYWKNQYNQKIERKTQIYDLNDQKYDDFMTKLIT